MHDRRPPRRRRPPAPAAARLHSENVPVAIAATANLNATSPDASLMRLSPLRISVTRDGSGRRSVMAAVATASVGDTIAPSANAAASGSVGINACSA